MKEDIKQRLLNLGSNIRTNILCALLSSKEIQEGKKAI
jgi:hypothetical protein